MSKSITSDELKHLLAGKLAPRVLDVRRKADYEAAPGKIAGADWHDPERIDAWIGQIPADRLTVAYCVKGGAISQNVTERLRRLGHEAAFLEGGIKAWSEQGNAVEGVSG